MRPTPTRRPNQRERNHTMAATPSNASSKLPGKPPVVDLATWQAAREELLVREKAHTREGDAIAAARRRLPMVELDGAVEVTGVDGPVPFLDEGAGRRAGQRGLGPARLEALRPPRGAGGPPRGLARGPSGRLAGRWAWRADLLVLALGRRRRRHLGPDQPARAAVDPPRRGPRGDPRPPGPPPLTRVPSPTDHNSLDLYLLTADIQATLDSLG